MPDKTQIGGEYVRLIPYDALGQAMVVGFTAADSLALTEFGELRSANPGNRADVEFINDLQPLIVDDISNGAGAATHQSNSRDVVLSVGASGAGVAGGLRLHYNVPYTPGSGQEIDITGVLDNAGLGGGTAQVFLRSTVTGSTTVETIDQSEWVSPPSDLDWSKSQIFRISFQSLKVGRIQFSIARNGELNKVAEINNDNERATGFWQYPSLPPYWKISNDSGNTIAEIGYGDEFNGVGFRYVFNGIQTTATARAICATVKSQGGLPLFELPGFPFAITSGNTAKTVSTSLIPVVSIQVASAINSIVNGGLYIPEAFSLQTNNPIRYQILYRPTLTNASFSAVDATYSGMNYDTAATAITGGIVIDEDYISSGNNRVIGEEGLLGRTIMSLGYNGTSDIITIAAIRTGSSDATVYGKIGWKEIR